MIQAFAAPFELMFYTITTFLTGDILLSRFRANLPVLIRGLICIALGYGIVGYYLIFLGHLGWLRPIPVTLSFVILVLFRYSRWRLIPVWLSEAKETLWRSNEDIATRFLQLLLLFALGITFLFCFLPEIAHDSLVYHINLPKLYAQTGSIKTYPYDIFSYRPILLECLYSLAFLWKCLPLAKLIHWLTGALLTLGIISTVEEKATHRLALFSGLMLFLTPLFINEIQTTYTDVGTAFFVFLSFYLFWQAMKKSPASLYFLSGILMGLGVSTKQLTGIAAVSMLAAFVICRLTPKSVKTQSPDQTKTWKALGLYVAGAALAYGYWAMRNAVTAGNPFFPFFPKLFPGSSMPLEQEFIQGGVAKTFLNVLLLPLLMTFSPDPFDRHHYIGPIYLIALPFFILAAFRSERIKHAALTMIPFFAVWFYLCQNYRFLSTILPLILLGGAWGFSGWHPVSKFTRILRTSVLWISHVALIAVLGLSFFHFRIHLTAMIQHWSPPRYLNYMERTFDIANWVNQNLPQNARILSIGEMHAFYFDRPFVASGDVYELKFPNASKMKGAELLNLFRAQGFTHLLVSAPVRSPNETYTLFRPLSGMLSKDLEIKELFRCASSNQRGIQLVYRLFVINGQAPIEEAQL